MRILRKKHIKAMRKRKLTMTDYLIKQHFNDLAPIAKKILNKEDVTVEDIYKVFKNNPELLKHI